jgi:DNA replication and repair protein RecF
LALTDFRSYTEVDVPLKPGVTIFSGPNGEGKTNLVEAVGYAAALASHRAAQDAPLIRKGADQAIIRAAISTGVNDALVEIELNAGRANRVRLNRTPLTRPRDVLGVLRTVLFAPEDLALVKGDPGERRRFLDDLLVAMAPRYAAVRADYDRVLKQRTALLKSAGPKGGPRGNQAGQQHNRQSREAVLATLDVWDAHLARTGAELLVAREHLVNSLRPHAERSYLAVAGGDRGPASIAYKRSFDSPVDNSAATHGERVRAAEQALREALLEVRASELDRGVCLAGPHRDELDLSVRDLPARGYASHGESWSMALALRLASFDLLRAGREDPVLILDDVFAELDAGRRDRLAALVAAAEQVLVTAAVPEDIPSLLTGVHFKVLAGTLAKAPGQGPPPAPAAAPTPEPAARQAASAPPAADSAHANAPARTAAGEPAAERVIHNPGESVGEPPPPDTGAPAMSGPTEAPARDPGATGPPSAQAEATDAP